MIRLYPVKGRYASSICARARSSFFPVAAMTTPLRRFAAAQGPGRCRVRPEGLRLPVRFGRRSYFRLWGRFLASAAFSFASAFGDSCSTASTSPLIASTFTSSIPLLPSVLKSNE